MFATTCLLRLLQDQELTLTHEEVLHLGSPALRHLLAFTRPCSSAVRSVVHARPTFVPALLTARLLPPALQVNASSIVYDTNWLAAASPAWHTFGGPNSAV